MKAYKLKIRERKRRVGVSVREDN